MKNKIDKAINDWGFATRAEFFRFCAIEFLKKDAAAISSDEALKGYSKSIHRIKAAKELSKMNLH